MTLTALTPWCSILSPSSAETGDHKTATESTSTALVPHPVSLPLEVDRRESEPFPFTKLPAELRNHIYRYVLKSSGPIHSYWFRKPTNPNFAAILQVSRLTNTEATVILYRENTFRFMARTLKVPFADAYPSNIIDIPSRFVLFLKRIAFTAPNLLMPATSRDAWCDSTHDIGTVISQLATAAPNLETIIHHNWYNRARYGILCGGGRWHPVFTAVFESIAKHRVLKELILVFEPTYREYPGVHFIEPQVFPGHEHVRVVVNRAFRELCATLKEEPRTFKVPLAMNGTDPAEVRRRLGLRGGAPTPQHLG